MVDKIFIGDKPLGNAAGGKVLGTDSAGTVKNFAIASQAQAEAGASDEIMTARGTRQHVLAGKAPIDTSSVSSFTPTPADNNSIKELVSSGDIPVELPNDMPKGFGMTFVQGGNGQIIFSAETGGTLRSEEDMVKSRVKNSTVAATVLSNASGTDAVWLLTGSME